MTYRLVHISPRAETVTEYDRLEDALAELERMEPKEGHRYLVVDAEDSILAAKPEIPEWAVFQAAVRRSSNQYAVYVSIPASVRDSMMLEPGDRVTVEIRRARPCSPWRVKDWSVCHGETIGMSRWERMPCFIIVAGDS